MRKLLTGLVAVFAVGLVWSESAAACSCAEPEGKETLRGYDAAVTARLIEVVDDPEPNPSGDATWRFRITRVFKGEKRHNLREREILELRWSHLISCSYPTTEGRRYGLRLHRNRRGFTANFCAGFAPKSLRRAASRSGGARSGGSGCSADV